jgi:hypothetical protein
LAGPYSAPGAKAAMGREVSSPCFATRGFPRGGIDREPRLRERPPQGLARRLGERGIALDDQGQCFLIEHPPVVHQPIAHFPAPTRAHRNARVPWDERRLERVRQDHRAIVAGEGFREPPALAQLQVPVPKGSVCVPETSGMRR